MTEVILLMEITRSGCSFQIFTHFQYSIVPVRQSFCSISLSDFEDF
jgi:hypothetical protein